MYTLVIARDGQFTRFASRSCLPAMPSLLRILLHPLVPLSVADGHSDTGLDVALLISFFSVAGIWLVYQRYHRMHNSPLPFQHNPPAVRIYHISDYLSSQPFRPQIPNTKPHPLRMPTSGHTSTNGMKLSDQVSWRTSAGATLPALILPLPCTLELLLPMTHGKFRGKCAEPPRRRRSGSKLLLSSAGA